MCENLRKIAVCALIFKNGAEIEKADVFLEVMFLLSLIRAS